MKLADAKVFNATECLYSIECTFRHFTTTYQVTLCTSFFDKFCSISVCFIVITFSLVLIITNQRCYCFNKYAKTIQRLFVVNRRKENTKTRIAYLCFLNLKQQSMILQLAFVLTAIIIGARPGGIGLGVMGGVGLAILTFVLVYNPLRLPSTLC